MRSKGKISARTKSLVCLECGLGFRMLKKHLASAHGLTPEAYRTRWELPKSFPMTAPAIARERSRLARELSIGCWPSRPSKP